MFRFLRIERPTTRPSARPRRRRRSPAASGGCWRRTRDEQRPVQRGMICRNASPTTRSERVKPGRSAFVESPSSRSTPRLPSSASLPDVGPKAVDRRVVDLPVARMEDTRRRRSRGRPRPSRAPSAPSGRTRARNGPSSSGSASGSASRSSAAWSSPCSSSFDLTSPSVRRVAQTSSTADLARQVRQRRQHDPRGRG